MAGWGPRAVRRAPPPPPPPPLSLSQLWDLYAREYVGPPADIWALGVLLYVLCFGKFPFDGESKLQVCGRVCGDKWGSARAA